MKMPKFKPIMNWEDVKEDFLYWQTRGMNSVVSLAERFTPIESIAYVVIFQLSQHFGFHNMYVHPQKKIGKYIVDFEVVYQPIEDQEPRKKIIVECDGHEFHEKTKEQVTRDKERDRFLTKQGYIILRYSGSELVRDRLKLYGDIEELLLPDHQKENYGYKTRIEG